MNEYQSWFIEETEANQDVSFSSERELIQPIRASKFIGRAGKKARLGPQGAETD